MKPKLTLGWIFVFSGTMFLMSGLVVMVFATLRPGMTGPSGGIPVEPSFWITLANALMTFVIQLIEIDWTPIRAGVFLIIVGLLMDGSGAYLMISSEKKPKRKPRKRTR